MAKNRSKSFYTDDFGGSEAPADPVEAPEEAPAEAPPVEAKSEPLLLARKFLRGDSSPVAKAFMAGEERAHGNRKLSQAQWQAAWDAFIALPR